MELDEIKQMLETAAQKSATGWPTDGQVERIVKRIPKRDRFRITRALDAFLVPASDTSGRKEIPGAHLLKQNLAAREALGSFLKKH